MKILLTGASGLIGTELIRELSRRGDQVITTRRVGQPGIAHLENVLWDPKSGEIEGELGDLDAAIHLAGYGIGNRRWNGPIKDEIYYSRIRGTQQIVSALSKVQKNPVRFISASAIGYYGDAGNSSLSETSPPGNTFLSKVVIDWEAQALKAQLNEDKVALLRSGVVLSSTGGALRKQSLIFKFGLGGKFGNGKNWISWIHIRDEVRAIIFLLNNPDIVGPVNLVSPNPVTNDEFTRTLARVVSRPALFSVPELALKLALGSEMASELLLISQKVAPNVLLDAGFKFEFPDLRSSLYDLLK